MPGPMLADTTIFNWKDSKFQSISDRRELIYKPLSPIIKTAYEGKTKANNRANAAIEQ